MYTPAEIQQMNDGQLLERWKHLNVLHKWVFNGQTIFIIQSRDHPDSKCGMAPVTYTEWVWFSGQWNASPRRGIVKTKKWVEEILTHQSVNGEPITKDSQ